MTSASAAAPLLTTCTPPASGTAAARAARAPAPRGPRRPVARSSSTSVAPPATVTASRAARESGARPRFVCTTTPVALSTSRNEETDDGSRSSTTATTSSGATAPSRQACSTEATTPFTTGRPSRRAASSTAGTASTASVRGVRRLGSSCTQAPSDGWRRRTGIEPPDRDTGHYGFEDRGDDLCPSPVPDPFRHSGAIPVPARNRPGIVPVCTHPMRLCACVSETTSADPVPGTAQSGSAAAHGHPRQPDPGVPAPQAPTG